MAKQRPPDAPAASRRCREGPPESRGAPLSLPAIRAPARELVADLPDRHAELVAGSEQGQQPPTAVLDGIERGVR